MLNFNSVIEVDDNLYSLFKRVTISTRVQALEAESSILPLYVMDLFPLMKIKRLSTIGTIHYLRAALLGNTLSIYNYKFIFSSFYIEELPKLKEEQCIARSLSELIYNLSLVSRQNYTIYDLVRVSYLLSHGRDNKNYIDNSINNKLIPILLEHPTIDPLFISVLLHSWMFTIQYLNNVRSNKSLVYRLQHSENLYISKIIRDELIIKIFLLREILSSGDVTHDIFLFIMVSEIL